MYLQVLETKTNSSVFPFSGISLSMDQWNVLRDHADEIDEAVAEA